MSSWYSRPQAVEMKDGTKKTEYHLCFETFDKDEAKRIEGVLKAVMDGKDINVPDTNVGDTISRQAVIDWASKIPIHDLSDGRGLCRVIFAEDFLKALKQLLLVTERTGHWIWDAGDLVCSECDTRYSDLYPDYDESVACPHCGAKMEVEHEQ